MILFEKTQKLDNSLAYYPRIFREAIEINKHINNFNKKEEAMKLNKVWFPTLKYKTKIKPIIKQEETPTTSSDLCLVTTSTNQKSNNEQTRTYDFRKGNK